LQVEVEFFDAPMTADLWEAYERATRSYGCTREFIEHFESPGAASLALIRSNRSGPPLGAFLFRRHPDRTISILGRLFASSVELLASFAEAVLERYPDVARIRTNFIDALPDAGMAGRPVLVVREASELRASLPAAVEDYERMLDRKYLKQVRYHERRFARECPASRVVTLEREEIPRAWVADVVRLNRERMALKKLRSVFDEHYEEGIFAVARAHGYVTALRDGERLGAGTVIIRCGDHAYAWVIGHDGAYAKYSPGTLCALAAIRHAIVRGVRTMHFLHGESSYKAALGGKPAPLASYLILRSWAMLRSDDISRLLVKHASLAARKAIRVADAPAERLLNRRDPIKTFLREIAHRVEQLARS
jgi:CelD/BcsL family acetyltransferase involved in cellulose biosynthesis